MKSLLMTISICLTLFGCAARQFAQEPVNMTATEDFTTLTPADSGSAATILADVKVQCAEDSKLKFISDSKIETYHNPHQDKWVISIESKTDDWWDDLPAKGQNKSTGGWGRLSVSFSQNHKSKLSMPLSKQGEYYSFTRWETDTINTGVEVYSFTGDSGAHKRLCKIVREAMEKHGVKIQKQ